MGRTPWSRLALLVTSTLCSRGAAALEPAPGAALRWTEVAAAAERHPALQEAAARERAAAGAVSAAGAIPNPTVGVSAGEGRPRDGGPSRREWGVSVELPLDFLATRGPRVASARASEEGARQDRKAVRSQVLRELRRTFVALAHGQAVLDRGAELEAEVAQLAALVRRRAERGEVRPTEVPRVELEFERLRATLERARAASETHRQRLSTWIGAPVSRVDGAELERLQDLPPLEALRERGLATSPAVLAARARLQAASADVRAERRERFPKVTVGGARSEELDRRATTLAATVTVPLWDWNGGKIRQAEAAAEVERARLDASSRELTAALSDAWGACAGGQAAARRFRAEILPRAEGSARTLGRAFELGEAGLLDVVDARRVLLDTRREYLDLLLDVQNTCGDLAVLAGLELP